MDIVLKCESLRFLQSLLPAARPHPVLSVLPQRNSLM